MEGPLETLEAEIGDPRGEFVLIIPPRSVDSAPAGDLTDAEVNALFGQITETGMAGRRASIRELARRTGRSQKDVYAALERVKIYGK
jgi:aminoglycoside phosphotransferase (APT) family kinase protein